MDDMKRMSSAMGADKPKAPKTDKKARPAKKKAGGKKKSKFVKPSRMSIEPTDNDRFVAKHSYDTQPGAEPQPDTTHSLSDLDDLKQHIEDHFGPGAEEATQQAAAAAPANPTPMPPTRGGM